MSAFLKINTDTCVHSNVGGKGYVHSNVGGKGYVHSNVGGKRYVHSNVGGKGYQDFCLYTRDPGTIIF